MAEQQARLRGIRISYETFGEPGGVPLLLVFGLGGQMIWWPDEFCAALAERGFHVVRFDNRDSGRSEPMSGTARPVRSLLRVSRPPYTLEDLADDAVALLDHLGLASAHVVGISMGGMIAQVVAIRHPERVRSLTSIMSTTGRPTVGFPTRWAVLRSLGRPTPVDPQGYTAATLARLHQLKARAFPFDEEYAVRLLERTLARGLSAEGSARQLAAVLAAPDRTRALRRVDVPALVVHGTTDPLVHVSGGRATARALPRAELLLVRGMGHDLPLGAWPAILGGIVRTAVRAGETTVDTAPYVPPTERSASGVTAGRTPHGDTDEDRTRR
ncbi:alpha/beta fold hydrolase [Auraticoccus monumenti]|uniref:Pimeloyl-ACP methyl ester carboxylesterase n=1 Tax=Auraticoccus monumenti TaxID=675864 RepID=A0A1G7BJ67_9ACTN|nr:alpha/beta fold hydrolase [Auraticoccus monumenti]SDE27109.1 Pimeloyl-ACP methyl ester carboxylesterase [Auraticoccus monumenti]